MTEPSGKDLLKYGFQVARAIYARKLYSDNNDQLTILHKSNKAIQIVSGSITLGASVTDQNVVIHEGTLSTQNIIGTTLTDNYSTLTQGSITNVKYFQSSVGSFTTLYGDGSNLTGISGGDHIFEGDTKVETIDSGSDGYIKFITDNSEKMRIDNNGYVGIGTTGPDRKLDILDNTNPQLRLTHTDGSNGTDLQSTSDSLLEISPVGASTANSLRVNSNHATCRMYMKGSSGPSLHMGIHSGSDLQAFFWNDGNGGIEFGTNDTERMRITNGGYVGIGTNNPLNIFDISAQQIQQRWSYDVSNYATMAVASNGASTLANSGGDFTIDSPGDIVLDAAGSDVIFKKSGTNYIKVTDAGSSNVQLYATAQLQMSANDSTQTYTFTGAQGGGQLNMYTRNGGSGNNINLVATQDNSDIMFNDNHLYITKSSGKIGIGEINPSTRLHINEGANASTGITVQGNGHYWQQYVATNGTYIFTNGSNQPYINSGNNNPMNFTGQHRSIFIDKPINDIKQMEGLIVSANKETYTSMSGSLTKGISAITINEALPDISLCIKEKDKSVFGVISTTEDTDNRKDSYGSFITPYDKEIGDTRPHINSVGEGAIWVSNKNNNLESGDYITTSSIPGYGMKQDDDFLHNYTVAKITMSCNFAPQTVPKKIILKDSNGDNILDTNGYVQFVDSVSETELQYNIRYLQSDGSIITESDYNNKLGNGESVYKAAFVGYTYHCG